AQRRRFLARLLAGEDLWCQGFSEPGAGYDLGALRTRGERRGGGFVVNGQKVWTSYADVADWCFLLCRTEPEAPKHHGISLLLVDMRSPGISVSPLMQITGDAEFSEVFFEDVRVPAEMMVGAPGASRSWRWRCSGRGRCSTRSAAAPTSTPARRRSWGGRPSSSAT